MAYRRLAAALLAGGCAAAFSSAACAQPPQPPQSPQSSQAPQAWHTSWSTALQEIPRMAALPPLYQAPPVAGRTVRQVIVPTLSGGVAQLRVSNRYGTRPLSITRVSIARSGAGAGIVPGSEKAVTFGGSGALVLRPGMEMDSDPIPIAVTRGARLAVSMVMGGDDAMQAWHRIAGRVNYVSSVGNHAGDISEAAFKVRFTQYAWITRLAVGGKGPGGVVAIGDSITDGLRSTLGADRSWPSVLAVRVATEGSVPMAVLNAGISGNRLLSGSPCYGDSLESRVEHDALALPGVHTVIVQVGINDINFSAMPPRRGLDCDTPHTVVSADDLVAGYRRVIAAAHHRGLRVLVGTLTPAALPPDREVVRQRVNRWIRGGQGFDGVVDFDKALRDPGQPGKLKPSYDSGDHVHPSDAGYAAMAHAVPLALLNGKPPPRGAM
ncbi:SGNH/GDSL hydrolase family protein [Bordetella genomosp. 10]|uniref:SGNH/GDSL hydrolase family protein n=1 Tax=Bordetella genomosp. 10 TaxID=1416804 RepID=UPI00359CBA16